jgi:hypothetical protein
MVRATNRPKVKRAVFRALVQAATNLGLYVAPEVAEHLERAKEAAFIPLEQLSDLLALAAAPYAEPAPVLERLGREMVDAWYQKEQGGALPNAVEELLAELGPAYRGLVHGDVTETGEVSGASFDPEKGELVVHSTTPFSRDLERGVLEGVLLRMKDVIGVEAERSRSPEQHRLRIWTHGAIARAPFDDDAPLLETSADDIRRLAHVGNQRSIGGRELHVFVQRNREVKRELRRTQALFRTTTSALGQALSDRTSQHRVLGKLVREHRAKTTELSQANEALTQERIRIEDTEASSRRLIDELCDRLPGSQIAGRYEVVRRLGHGVASSVFEVFDSKRKDRASLRVVRSTRSGVGEKILGQAERMREAELSNVPAVRGVTVLAGAASCVVTDAVRGRSLRRVLAERGRLEEEVAATIVGGLLEVLANAHASGLVHGNVRPETIVVSGDATLLLELELAPVFAELPHSSASAAYRAPESDDAPPAPETDVFAAGAVLLELLTGDPPEHGVARRVPASRIGALCVTALDPNPKSRPRARELSDALSSLAPRVSLAELAQRHPRPAEATTEESGVHVASHLEPEQIEPSATPSRGTKGPQTRGRGDKN